MHSTIYWIESPKGGLAIMARPRSGDWLEDEIAYWQSQRIRTVVSLLESHERVELALEDEEPQCATREIEFVSFPIPDRGVPNSIGEAVRLTDAIAARLEDGDAVAIHCRAGIGRSSLIAACVLVRSGLDTASAFKAIEQARGLRVPDTEEQRVWVDAFPRRCRELDSSPRREGVAEIEEQCDTQKSEQRCQRDIYPRARTGHDRGIVDLLRRAHETECGESGDGDAGRDQNQSRQTSEFRAVDGEPARGIGRRHDRQDEIEALDQKAEGRDRNGRAHPGQKRPLIGRVVAEILDRQAVDSDGECAATLA
jgi:protein-tyrosine phosphatase